MKPKDEVSEMNLALQLYEAKAIDPIGLYKKLDSADPMADAKRLVMWLTSPQQYAQMYFPEVQPQQPPQQGGGNAETSGTPPPNLGGEPANANLSQVKMPPL